MFFRYQGSSKHRVINRLPHMMEWKGVSSQISPYYKYTQFIKTPPCNNMCPYYWSQVPLIYLFSSTLKSLYDVSIWIKWIIPGCSFSHDPKKLNHSISILCITWTPKIVCPFLHKGKIRWYNFSDRTMCENITTVWKCLMKDVKVEQMITRFLE